MPEIPPDPPVHLSAEDVRGGEIVLRTRARRLAFVAGLAAVIVIVALAWAVG